MENRQINLEFFDAAESYTLTPPKYSVAMLKNLKTISRNTKNNPGETPCNRP